MDGSGDSGRRPVETDGAPAPIGPYSQAVAAGGGLHCSGQGPLDPPTSEVVEGGGAAQARPRLPNPHAGCRPPPPGASGGGGEYPNGPAGASRASTRSAAPPAPSSPRRLGSGSF